MGCSFPILPLCHCGDELAMHLLSRIVLPWPFNGEQAQGSESQACGLASYWTLDFSHILPPLSLVLFRSWGLWMRMPGFGGLQKAAAMRAEGLPETQVLE